MVHVERDQYTEHVKDVKALEAVGISPPTEWTAMHKRLTEYLALDTPVRAKLIDAIGEGKGDIAALRAGAYAEAAVSPQTNRAVIAGVHHKLLAIYAGVAPKNHARLASEFNKLAKEFTTLAGVVDVESDATLMVDAPEDQRQAWIAAPLIAAELDSRLPALRSAVALCGVPTKGEEVLLAMAIDPGPAHRRALWTAWASTGRAGRWSAIVKCGAEIHAGGYDHITPYRHPKPLVHEQQRRDGLVLNVVRDPEDEATAVA